MKKLFLIFLVMLLCFACNDGLTQKEQCENKVGKADGALDPAFCAFYIAGVNSGEANPNFIDFFLLQCANYQNQIRKCNNKSEFILGDL